MILPRSPQRRGRGRPNWARRQGELLLSVAELLEALPPEATDRTGLREGVTVLDLARELLALLEPEREGRRRAAGSDLPELTSRIRRAAVERLTTRPQVDARRLGASLAVAWELATAAGRPLTVDPAVSEAAARERLRRAPRPIRRALRGRRLVASDAGWELGRGTPLFGSAAAIVLYLYGRGRLPARATTPTPAGDD